MVLADDSKFEENEDHLCDCHALQHYEKESKHHITYDILKKEVFCFGCKSDFKSLMSSADKQEKIEMERFIMNVDFTFDKLFGEGSGRQCTIMGTPEI